MTYAFRARDLVALPRIDANRAFAIGEKIIAAMRDEPRIPPPIAKAANAMKVAHLALAHAMRDHAEPARIQAAFECFGASVERYLLQVAAHAELEGGAVEELASRLLAPMVPWWVSRSRAAQQQAEERDRS